MPLVLTGLIMLIIALPGYLLVFRPMQVTYVPKEPTANTSYWELSTGSRLAYAYSPASGTARPIPVILLHGGPGVPEDFQPQPIMDQLNASGFNVYRYDQVGSGLSNRLNDIRAYTVERHVADLEAIRQTLGTEQVILVGTSWGGTLAAHYVAAYPNRVARLVFSSPGAIWAPSYDGKKMTNGSENSIISAGSTPRFLVVQVLQQLNPTAAQQLASDEEMSGFFQPLIGQVIGNDRAGCQTAPTPYIPAGLGYYANMMTTRSIAQTPDARPQLAQVSIPTLILRGECDRLLRDIAQEYQQTFRNAQLIEIAGVGHIVRMSPQYANLVQRFLTE